MSSSQHVCCLCHLPIDKELGEVEMSFLLCQNLQSIYDFSKDLFAVLFLFLFFLTELNHNKSNMERNTWQQNKIHFFYHSEDKTNQGSMENQGFQPAERLSIFTFMFSAVILKSFSGWFCTSILPYFFHSNVNLNNAE